MKKHKSNRQLQLFKIMCQQKSQLGDWDGKNYVFHIRHVPKSEMQHLITHYNIGKRFYMFLRNRVRFYKRGKVVASRKIIRKH